jgi:hypothetical protein
MSLVLRREGLAGEKGKGGGDAEAEEKGDALDRFTGGDGEDGFGHTSSETGCMRGKEREARSSQCRLKRQEQCKRTYQVNFSDRSTCPAHPTPFVSFFPPLQPRRRKGPHLLINQHTLERIITQKPHSRLERITRNECSDARVETEDPLTRVGGFGDFPETGGLFKVEG